MPATTLGPTATTHPAAPAAPPRPALTAGHAWALAVIGLLAVRAGCEVADLLLPGTARDARLPPHVVALVVALGAVAVLACWWPWRRRSGTVPLVLGVASSLLAGTGTAVLHGTRWGFDGLYSDAGFRTEMVTRYADSPALADYAYRDLPAYYPPLLPWLQGRTAALLDVPGWTVMKPAQLTVCLLVPVLAWLLWRRVLPDDPAAWVAAAASVTAALPHKPDEWLVLVLLVPWWLEVCRGVTQTGRRRWGPLAHGLVLGLLLLCHTYFFLPLGLATLLGAAADLALRRPVHPRPARSVVVGLVALVVATPTWWALAWGRLAGLPKDDLQLRWSPVGFDRPPLPVPDDALGALQLLGVLWLVVALRHSRLARGLALALVAAYAVMIGGQLLQGAGVAVLPEKSQELIEVLLAVSGVLGAAALPSAARRVAPRSSGPAVAAVMTVTAVVGGVLVVVETQQHGVARVSQPAQTMRYPDGTFPAGGPVPGSPHWHPWGVRPGASGPSVDEVREAWRAVGGGALDDRVVLVTARADVAATTPVHLFTSWKSIYSHPNAQFAARLERVRDLGRCATPACARGVLDDDRFDRVDGLLLNRDAKGWFVSVAVDRFPEAWERETVRLDPGLFSSPAFRTHRLPGAVVVRVVR